MLCAFLPVLHKFPSLMADLKDQRRDVACFSIDFLIQEQHCDLVVVVSAPAEQQPETHGERCGSHRLDEERERERGPSIKARMVGKPNEAQGLFCCKPSCAASHWAVQGFSSFMSNHSSTGATIAKACARAGTERHGP